MPIFIALSVIALLSLSRPFRGLAVGLLLLGTAVSVGIAMILWRFWMDCKNVGAYALGRENVRREEESAHRFHTTFSDLSQSLGDSIPLRLSVQKRGKGSRAGQSDGRRFP